MGLRTAVVGIGLGGVVLSFLCPAVAGQSLERFDVAGDAIAAPLGNLTGNADRGRAIVLDRTSGNCLICHKVPVASEPFQGELGPDLGGIGARRTTGQIRLRLVDQSRLDPQTLMPPLYRVDNLTRVAEQFRDKPVLDAQQIEDVVAWLSTLKGGKP
jgi:L-cysteine S-thiosulfotransferase